METPLRLGVCGSLFDKHYVGLDLTSVQDNGLQRPVSRVTLLLDNENSITAGDDTGAELLADCPHATQAMANAILAQVKGYQYRMFTADDAALDPSAELGDGVTAGGLYAVLSRCSDDGSGYAGITAPGEAELEDEFPAGGPMTSVFNRKIAQTRSQILKTAAEITLLVENEVEGLEGKLKLTAGSLTAEINSTREGLGTRIEQTAGAIQSEASTREGEISSLRQTARELQSTVRDQAGDISTIRQSVDSIDLNVNGSSIELTKDGVTVSHELTAAALAGRIISILDERGRQAGTFMATGASSYSGQKLQLHSGAIELIAAAGDLFLNGSGTTLQLGDGQAAVAGDLIPNASSRYALGSGAFPWTDVYADNDAIVASDRNRKKDISYDLSAYGQLFHRLRPVRYRLKDGTSGRVHLGLIAQEVEEALTAAGLTAMDFAGLVKAPRADGGFDYALRYGELIALCIAQIQELTARIEALERRTV